MNQLKEFPCSRCGFFRGRSGLVCPKCGNDPDEVPSNSVQKIGSPVIAISIQEVQKEYLGLFVQLLLLAIGLPLGYLILTLCTAGKLGIAPWFNDSIGFELSSQRIFEGWSQNKHNYRCTPELTAMVGISFASLLTGVFLLFLSGF